MTTTEQPPAVRAFGTEVGALVCVGLALLVSWGGFLVLVAGRVVPGWGMGAGFVLGGLLLLRLGAVASRAGSREGVRRVPRWALVTAAGVGGAGVLFAAAGDLLNEAEYYVLEPAGPGGCRVVVRETSFLVIGNGEAYRTGFGGLGWRVGGWTVDDGYRPIRAGTYELTWGYGGGVLSVGGTGTDPVVRSDLPLINCD
ncbi:hypothetical protein AB0E75_16445 [Streptomyces griseoviridis]|uniref:Uncharacterized protein n=3 Tax=Streptomyces TaxID=1883 RepID=A0A918GTL2_STRGD|nr:MULTISPECIES: hypothetical protein [Streptomyces]MDP9682637.1 hypothetical protein [Streptomyces griseoviridis]GGS58869.1 hypothetical protein GCM10010238_55190 [Streptomyces niveoruber]GGT11545.1 hypothetical protein GCM10010240_51350 [Streptomyces griseoviridis]GGU54667.1 hypothetical protein GCM10010259_52360 [Streptomyces daghestanicus]GHI32271.1 hypothetical protein Sdagh_40010 [Streptomyces daghestanicus]